MIVLMTLIWVLGWKLPSCVSPLDDPPRATHSEGSKSLKKVFLNVAIFYTFFKFYFIFLIIFNVAIFIWNNF